MSFNAEQLDDEKRDDKQRDGTKSHDISACTNDSQIIESSLHNQSGKKKYDRKLLLLILLMFIAVAQVIVLLANSGFIHRSPEPVTLTEIKEVEDDLKKVIKSLNEINAQPKLKDDQVDVKEVIVKPAAIVRPAPIVKAAPVIKHKPVKPLIVKKPEPVKIPLEKVVKQEPVLLAPVQHEKVQVKQVTAPVVLAPPAVIEKEIKPLYVKYDINGKILEEDKEKWTCVHDTKNKLMWEVKSKNDPMRNSKNLYSWFNPDNKSLKGVIDGGRCKGDADCDTNSYVKAMNKQKFCGHDDWRLPTREEMMGLVSYDAGKIKINSSYFPQALPSWYWTASSNESRPEFAWYVLFNNGRSLNDLKENPKHIRLVRSDSSS